jgi:DNA primase catalytic core
MIKREQVNDILLAADLANVVEESGIKLKRTSPWLRQGVCPFHDEKDGSFYVNTRTNTYKCYGCGEWGNAIDFLMKKQALTFVEAARRLAGKHGIHVEEFTPTKEQEAEEKLRRQLLKIYEEAAQFYCLQLESNPKALEYARSRFSDKTIDNFRIGFALDDYSTLYRHLRNNGHSMEILEKSELFRQKKDGGNYDFFRYRLMFPIFDITGRVIAFSGRKMPDGDENSPKYINSSESPIYQKKNVLFGLNFALPFIRQQDTAVIVEGYADVIKLHQLGVTHVVASCGTALTDEQIRLLGRATRNFCLLYDSDAAGQAAAEKNGKRITEVNFNTYTLTLPNNCAGEKQDPDTFFQSAEHFKEFYSQHRENFLFRFTKSKAGNADDPTIKSLAIKEIALLFYKRPESERFAIVESLSEILKPKKLWLKVIAELEKEAQASRSLKELTGNGRTNEQNKSIEKYGFYEEKNCYYFYAPKGEGFFQGSNFTLEPLFHIESAVNAKRLYRLKNEYDIVKVLELSQKDLIAISAFRLKCESLGNFRFDGGEYGLSKIKAYLYEKTRSCKEIIQLGWQKEGFFAWSNGIFSSGNFTEVDELGIVEHAGVFYYIPALSSFYRQDDTLFQFERRFKYLPGTISLYEYAEKLVVIYGDNAIVGLSYFMASLFRDIIVSIFRFFPILNIFGPKGTGKSELAVSLLKLFGDLPVGINMTTTTIAAMADHVSHTRNALCHIDEYKNSVDYDKIEFLKGIWDGVGRSRMNMEKDRKKEMTAVDTGIILTGQEMTTADNALFSRVIFLSYSQTKFSDEAKARFENFKKLEKRGLTHLTAIFLGLRSYIQENYTEHYNLATEDILKIVEKNSIEDRILKNWIIPLAAFRCINAHISLPFSYDETVGVFAQMMNRQNSEVFSGNEVSDFWNIYQELFSTGLIENRYDLQIRSVDELKCVSQHYQRKMRVLFMNPIRIFSLYAQSKKNNQEKKLPKDTLQYYLQNAEEYLGLQQTRFRKPVKNLQEQKSAYQMPGDGTVFVEYERPYAWCFDYDKLVKRMGLNLETEFDNEEEKPEENI